MHHMAHIWTTVMLEICKHTFYAYLSQIWKMMQFTGFIRKVFATKILLSGKFLLFVTLPPSGEPPPSISTILKKKQDWYRGTSLTWKGFLGHPQPLDNVQLCLHWWTFRSAVHICMYRCWCYLRKYLHMLVFPKKMNAHFHFATSIQCIQI